jgi:hypothetical protein
MSVATIALILAGSHLAVGVAGYLLAHKSQIAVQVGALATDVAGLVAAVKSSKS